MADALVDRIKAQAATIAELQRMSGAPGLSLGVFHNGRVVHTAHIGQRSIESLDAPNDDTVHTVASTFKIVTASAVARLVTDGALAWDEPIRNYLPGLTRDDDFGLKATLQDLLSNRTGLPNANFYWGQQMGEHLIKKEEILAIVNSIPAVKPLRSAFIYSQWNYCLLQLIVERVTGKSWGDYVRHAIFDPLGLTTATFDEPVGTNVMMPHATRNDGSVSHISITRWNSPSGLSAAAGGKTSLKDHLTLYIAFLNAYRHQTTHQVDETPGSPFTQLRTILSPHVSLPKSKLEKQAYCLGVYRTQLPGNLSCASLNALALPPADVPIFGTGEGHLDAEELFHHTANTPGSVGAMFLVPRTQSGVIVMSNGTPLVDAPDFIAQRLLSILLETPIPQNQLELAQKVVKTQLGWYDQLRSVLDGFRTDTPPTHPLAAYAGTYYHSHHNFKIVVTVLGTGLLCSIQGLPLTTFELKPYDGDTFFWETDREREVVDRGMWIVPIPQYHVVYFDADEDGVRGLSWQHERLMEPDVFVKKVEELRPRL